VGTGGIECARRAVAGFLSGFWLNNLGGLKPGILLGGGAVAVKSLVWEIHAFFIASVADSEGFLERLGGKSYKTVK